MLQKKKESKFSSWQKNRSVQSKAQRCLRAQACVWTDALSEVSGGVIVTPCSMQRGRGREQRGQSAAAAAAPGIQRRRLNHLLFNGDHKSLCSWKVFHINSVGADCASSAPNALSPRAKSSHHTLFNCSPPSVKLLVPSSCRRWALL